MFTEINSLKFRITECTCEDSRASYDNFSCTGDSPLPQDSNLTVSCVDGSDGSELDSWSVRFGDVIEVKGPNDSALPDMTNCTVTDDAQAELQVITINTSGDVGLFLKDKFGILELEGCQVGDDTKDCIVPIVYSYEVNNLVIENAFITDLERTRESTTLGLVDRVLSQQDFFENYVGTVVEEDTIDICLDGVYNTSVRAEITTQQGETCSDDDKYEFDICSVDVEITCISDDGRECNELEIRDDNCMSTLTFTITLRNVGTKDINVTDFSGLTQVMVSRTEGRLSSFRLLDDIGDGILSGGEVKNLPLSFFSETVNFCTFVGVYYNANVEATQEIGGSCQVSDTYSVDRTSTENCRVSW